ncbi:MAG: hypothetical protein SGI74_10835 [Oligoflexia bacterium]|nr:hypothetical protein [Oligoflexia bacterium]
MKIFKLFVIFGLLISTTPSFAASGEKPFRFEQCGSWLIRLGDIHSNLDREQSDKQTFNALMGLNNFEKSSLKPQPKSLRSTYPFTLDVTSEIIDEAKHADISDRVDRINLMMRKQSPNVLTRVGKRTIIAGYEVRGEKEIRLMLDAVSNDRQLLEDIRAAKKMKNLLTGLAETGVGLTAIAFLDSYFGLPQYIGLVNLVAGAITLCALPLDLVHRENDFEKKQKAIDAFLVKKDPQSWIYQGRSSYVDRQVGHLWRSTKNVERIANKEVQHQLTPNMLTRSTDPHLIETDMLIRYEKDEQGQITPVLSVFLQFRK